MNLNRVNSILTGLGFTPDAEQPHMSGERFLMMREKVVLMAHQGDKQVVSKAGFSPLGKAEIEKEKRVRDTLSRISFTTESLLLPEELFYGEEGGHLFFITAFIPQEKVFPAYDIRDQFFMSLTIFEEQEAFHATTLEHFKALQKTFDMFDARRYFAEMEKMAPGSAEVREGLALLKAHKTLIDKYSNYLTHTDLAPGNTRIHNREIYMLDLSSFAFGNKYEGWARFLNWALVHSPELEELLIDYVKKNRGPEEYLMLRLMRVYKAAYLVDYYDRSLKRTEGDLHALTQVRKDVWSRILKAFIEDKKPDPEMIQTYREKRNTLRSPEETERQKEINIPTL